MARIRSVHPGLWTDEKFVSLSPFGRLLSIGIWNECDDMGSFEWSPLKLKMRLLPADTADVAQLLDELVVAGLICRYDVGGKPYGAVRNFCQYQRPKKPGSTYPQTDVVRNWVNVNARSTRDGGEPDPSSKSRGGEARPRSTKANGEVVGNQLPTGREKPRQRKDGGGSTVTNVTAADAAPVDPVKVLFDAGVALLTAADIKGSKARSIIGRWRNAYGDAATSAAIVSAAGKSDPVAWVEARLRALGGGEDEAAAVSRATAERYRRLDMPGPPPGVLEGVN